jgi:serine protease Do
MEKKHRTFGRWLVLVAGLALGVAIGAGVIGLRETRAVTPERTPQAGASTAAAADPSALSVAEQLSRAFAAVATKVNPSVVTVFTETDVHASASRFGSGGAPGSPFEQFFGDEFFRRFFETPQPQGDFKRSGLGSGVIISENGVVLTNNHVIDDADNVKVRLIDGREFEAKVKGRDPETDLAVLTIDAKGLQPIAFGNSDGARVGDWVLAVGSPMNPQLEHSVTSGIISAKGRSAVGLSQYEDYIQTDAAINPGNSGGALVDLKGELIGINTAIASANGGFSGIGFAIPANLARSVADDIVQKGKVVRGWLGVSVQNISPDMAKALKLETNNGVIVTAVQDDSPAHKAGLRTEDVIVGLDRTAIDNATELSTKIASVSPGTTVTLGVVRDGKPRDVRVTLGELAPKPEQELVRGRDSYSGLGLVVADITPDLAQKYDIPKDTQGVVVASVDPNSVANEIGIQEGDVIVKLDRKEIRSVKEFDAEISKATAGEQVLLYVRRGDANFFAAFTMPSKMLP